MQICRRKTISLDDDGGNRDSYDDNENNETIIIVDKILIASNTYQNKAVRIPIVK